MSHQPNLLVILADQLQRQALGCYGGPDTPHLDRLAERSVVFDRAYCATPLCVPTRPSIQTGLYPHRHGSRSFGADHQVLRPGQPLLVDHLAAAGYTVGYDGIWHVNRAESDRPRQEQTFAILREGTFPYQPFRDLFVRQGGRDGAQRAPVRTRTDHGWHDWTFSLPLPATWTGPPAEHPDRARAERVATDLRAADGPFAWFCSFAAPHPPLLVPAEYCGRRDPARFAPPVSLGQDPATLPEQVREAPGAQATRGWTWAEWAWCVAAYHDYVAFLDDNVGLLLAALDQAGLADSTVVLFLADHGECLGAHNLYQKGVAYEESSGIPLLLEAPGLGAGRRGEPVSQVDLAPTLLELLGLPAPDEGHGRSLLQPIRREAVGIEFNGYLDGGPAWRALASERYKYVWYTEGEEQLFDLADDPAEQRNLAAEPGRAMLLRALRGALREWQAETADDLPGPEIG